MATLALRDRFFQLGKGRFHIISVGYNKSFEPDTKLPKLLLDLTDFEQIPDMFAPLIQFIW